MGAGHVAGHRVGHDERRDDGRQHGQDGQPDRDGCRPVATQEQGCRPEDMGRNERPRWQIE